MWYACGWRARLRKNLFNSIQPVSAYTWTDTVAATTKCTFVDSLSIGERLANVWRFVIDRNAETNFQNGTLMLNQNYMNYEHEKKKYEIEIIGYVRSIKRRRKKKTVSQGNYDRMTFGIKNNVSNFIGNPRIGIHWLINSMTCWNYENCVFFLVLMAPCVLCGIIKETTTTL